MNVIESESVRFGAGHLRREWHEIEDRQEQPCCHGATENGVEPRGSQARHGRVLQIRHSLLTMNRRAQSEFALWRLPQATQAATWLSASVLSGVAA